jgi:TPR repeat protein
MAGVSLEAPDGPLARAPSRVQLGPDINIFDPKTGSPMLWFWRKGEADYEFFDGPGFHPRNGETLKSFTMEETKTYEAEVRAKQQRLNDEQARLEQEKKEREKKDAAEAQERAGTEERQKKKREQELQRATEIGRLCDELAANPNDQRKVGEGVSYSVLKAQARNAVRVCEKAVSQNPNELRFRYQLGRALQWTDRDRAFGIHEELVDLGYPAAFDNLGWLYFTDKQDPGKAVALFRKGVLAGDPDSMVSLAEMISRGHAVPSNSSETTTELYRRAAGFGHRQAQVAYQNESASHERGEEDRIRRLQQEQMMMQFLGTVLRNVHRR